MARTTPHATGTVAPPTGGGSLEGRSSPSRGGRRRDPSRDVAILDAAIEVLVEEGFDGMTVDTVAARAKAGKATLYRRWPSKVELVLDAVAHMQHAAVEPDQLPDTGTLRGDLTALIRPKGLDEAQRRLRVMTALTSLSARDPRLAEAATTAGSGAWVAANQAFISRAIARGEFPAGADVDTLARLIPMMVACRAGVQQQPVTGAFITTLIDAVLIPALRGSAGGPGPARAVDVAAPAPADARGLSPSQFPPAPSDLDPGQERRRS